MPDFTTLIPLPSFHAIILGILSIATLIAALNVAIGGTEGLIDFIRGQQMKAAYREDRMRTIKKRIKKRDFVSFAEREQLRRYEYGNRPRRRRRGGW